MLQNRLRELDFLRGIAIILVLLRHRQLFAVTSNMGWIGVDLFFVLSGFLVSKLLFKEYSQFGNIAPKRFLIRRGFKIYPIYYLFYLPYLIFRLPDIEVKRLLGDLFFMQNYVYGWGYAFGASWSLAIEEHFYFGFALLFFVFLKYHAAIRKFTTRFSLVHLIVVMMAVCLILRIVSNIYFPAQEFRNFTMTHLRIDSLLAGVLVSYLHHFRIDTLKNIFFKHQYALMVIAVLGLSWTPFIDPVPSFFVRTFGFTLLYISFGIVLTTFLLVQKTNQILDRLLSRRVVDSISKIGFASYSIYIIHTLVNTLFEMVYDGDNNYFIFIATSALSIATGMLMTRYIEKYFLNLRDRYYPGRI